MNTESSPTICCGKVEYVGKKKDFPCTTQKIKYSVTFQAIATYRKIKASTDRGILFFGVGDYCGLQLVHWKSRRVIASLLNGKEKHIKEVLSKITWKKFEWEKEAGFLFYRKTLKEIEKAGR